MWIESQDLPKPPGHVFYRKLNRLLAEIDFDSKVEKRYAEKQGRPSIPPDVYFRMLVIGFLEGIGSQRGIAWRCSDSLSLREFLGPSLTESPPDHSSLTRVRDRLPLQVHEQVFQMVLQLAGLKKLLKGQAVGVDATTLEANAAMKSILRKDTGEDWNDYLRRLIREEEGNDDPTDDELRRFDKRRKGKKVSNEDWQSSTDDESRIARMKDGRTHLAYKAEHTVELDSEIILAAEIYDGDQVDPSTIEDSVHKAQLNLQQAQVDYEIREVIADKGYHSAKTLEAFEQHNVSHLHSRTGLQAQPQVDEQAWDPTTSGIQQSPSLETKEEQAASTSAKRASRTELCPCLRDRRSKTELVTRQRKSSKAILDRCCGEKSRDTLPPRARSQWPACA